MMAGIMILHKRICRLKSFLDDIWNTEIAEEMYLDREKWKAFCGRRDEVRDVLVEKLYDMNDALEWKDRRLKRLERHLQKTVVRNGRTLATAYERMTRGHYEFEEGSLSSLDLGYQELFLRITKIIADESKIGGLKSFAEDLLNNWVECGGSKSLVAMVKADNRPK